MQPYQQRVVDEKTELDTKLSKLRDFLVSDKFNSVAADEQTRLKHQVIFMEGYSIVLGQRIANFKS